MNTLRTLWRYFKLGLIPPRIRQRCGAQLYDVCRTGTTLVATCDRYSGHHGGHFGDGRVWSNHR